LILALLSFLAFRSVLSFHLFIIYLFFLQSPQE